MTPRGYRFALMKPSRMDGFIDLADSFQGFSHKVKTPTLDFVVAIKHNSKTRAPAHTRANMIIHKIKKLI